MTTEKITKRLIDRLLPGAASDIFIWDSELKGFGVRLKPSGAASYLVQYRTPQGQTRRLAFARVGTKTPEEARKRARSLLNEVSDGGDPSSSRKQTRDALTVQQLCEAYMEAARAGLVTTRFGRSKSKSTVEIDEGRVSRHIVPLIGRRLVTELTKADVQRMADDIAKGKTAATIKTKPRGVARVTGGAGNARRIASFFGGIWSWAEKRGLVSGSNPAHGLSLRADQAKDRVLSVEELGRLGKSIRHHALIAPMAADALSLIALTALRRTEAYGLKWAEIDYEGHCLRLMQSKTGKSTRPIGSAAMALLKGLPKKHDTWVFPNLKGTGPAYLAKQVDAIFDAVGLTDARGHDLRRTYASWAADEGYGDATIGELLGHARRGVTARHYIRRPDAALLEAADRVSGRIVAALQSI